MTLLRVFLALVACVALAFAGGSCQGAPTAVLDVPFTFALQGANQTINGDHVICADLGNSTSGLGIYVQSLDNAAPALSSGAVNAEFTPLLLAIPFMRRARVATFSATCALGTRNSSARAAATCCRASGCFF